MNKKITVYYAKDADEAARIQAVLQANGIEAEEKSLGEHVYHDIYGGNGGGREGSTGQGRHQGLVLWKRNYGKIQKSFRKNPHCRCRPSCYHPSVSEINQTIENGCTRITFRIQ